MTVAAASFGDDAEMVVACYKWGHPAQAGGGEVLAVAVPYASGLAVDEELGGLAVGVDLDHLLLVRLAPADGPGVSVEVRHGYVGPVGLEDVVGLFLRACRASMTPF